MISSFRNFAKTKFAGLLVFIMIIPFVFWGMGSMFSSGNTNNLVKINDTNVSTKEFIDYINEARIPQETIRRNLDNNIIEELVSTVVSTTLMDLEIKDFDLIISKTTLLKRIKQNKNFLDEQGKFQRIKYEKFLLEKNQSATGFESRLKERELQKHLFEYIGAGLVSPNFLTIKLFEEENKKLNLEYIKLNEFYIKKENITKEDMNIFLTKNKDQLKIEYLDFNYTVINPKNLIGVDDFNQAFFDKIDQLEIDISNDVEFETITSNLNLKSVNVNNFQFSADKNEIEKKIFELRNNKFDIFEIDNDYILYKIKKINQREPNLNDTQTYKEILELVHQKNKFDYNRKLLEQIKDKSFDKQNFLTLGQDKVKSIILNSVKDNKKFDINSVQLLYSLPQDSLTLINDENNNIYLARIKEFQNIKIDNNYDQFDKYSQKEKINSKTTLLKSYDLFLNNKYDVIINQKTMDRVKNFFR